MKGKISLSFVLKLLYLEIVVIGRLFKVTIFYFISTLQHWYVGVMSWILIDCFALALLWHSHTREEGSKFFYAHDAHSCYTLSQIGSFGMSFRHTTIIVIWLPGHFLSQKHPLLSNKECHVMLMYARRLWSRSIGHVAIMQGKYTK